MNENLAKLLEKFPLPVVTGPDASMIQFAEVLALRGHLIDFYFAGVREGIESLALSMNKRRDEEVVK